MTYNVLLSPTNNILVTYGALQVLYCIVLYCIVEWDVKPLHHYYYYIDGATFLAPGCRCPVYHMMLLCVN